MLGLKQIIGRILMESPKRERQLERIRRRKADKIKGYQNM